MDEKKDHLHDEHLAQADANHIENGSSDQEKDLVVENDPTTGEKTVAEIQYTQKEADAVIRKLDWRLMPLIFILYSLSVLDRSNLGNARIAGLEDSIDLGGNHYDWLSRVFYIACQWHRSKRLSYLLTRRRYIVPVDSDRLESVQVSCTVLQNTMVRG
jgi:hypothetical protein